MLVGLFYILWVGFTVMFGYIFQILIDFTSPLFYGLALISIIMGFLLSIGTILAGTDVLGRLRLNKGYLNKFNHYFAKQLLILGLHIARVKVVVTGRENIPKDKFVFVCNHQENYDIVIWLPVFKGIPIIFIGKEPLFKAPIIGNWITALGNVPIGREADRAAAQSIITAIKRYKDGSPAGIFPEGRRSFGNEMIDFKPGAFKLATKPQANILIGTLYDVSKVLKRFTLKRYIVRVHIHPVLKYEEYQDMNTIELAAKVKAIIQKKIDEFDQAKR